MQILKLKYFCNLIILFEFALAGSAELSRFENDITLSMNQKVLLDKVKC